MGFFDKFMNALGFASEADLENMENRKMTKDNPPAQSPIQSEYNFNQTKGKDIISFSPATQEEVENIVEFLKNGASVKIDLSEFCEADLFRALDFLQGAAFALSICPVFEDEHTVILEQ